MRILEIMVYRWFVITSFFLCLFYAIIFEPVGIENQGDQETYLQMAFDFNEGIGVSSMQTHRSPLYPLILSCILSISGPINLLDFIVFFQFILVFISSLIVFHIFKRIIKDLWWVFGIGILFLLSFSTLSFAYTIVSEILTIFLFLLSALLNLLYFEKSKPIFLIFAGTILGLAILARFNLLVLPIFIVFSILCHQLLIAHEKKLSFLISNCLIYVGSVLFVLNLWCMYNVEQHGSYFLFPKSHMGKRFTAMALVKDGQDMPVEYRKAHNIILKAKNDFLLAETNSKMRKSSLFNMLGEDRRMHYIELTMGYRLFMKVADTLFVIYNINPQLPDAQDQLASKMRGYYNILEKQSPNTLLELRLFSLLNSFKYSSSGDSQYHRKNLAKLPSAVILSYKFLFLLISGAFIILSLVFIVRVIIRKTYRENFIVLFLLLLVSYFPAINFMAVTYSDASRFKFPAEPLIFGLLFYYFYLFIWVKRKRFNIQQQ